MFSLKPKYKMRRIFDQPIGMFLYFFFLCSENFTLYHNKRLLCADPCCHSIMKEFAYAFSCAYIESWMHLGSLESTQKARVTLGCTWSYSYAFFMLSKVPACIRYTHIKHEQILNYAPGLDHLLIGSMKFI